MSGQIIPFPVAPKVLAPQSRVTVVDVTDRDPAEFVVGIEYETGEHILAGASHRYAKALDAARQRATALWVQAFDFTSIGEGNEVQHG